MDLLAYTVFYCKKHNKGYLIENIHKDVPKNFSMCNQHFTILDVCQKTDWHNIGYITVNDGCITADIKQYYNCIDFPQLSADPSSIKSPKLVSWLNKKYCDTDECSY